MSERKYYIDILKFISTILVIGIHLAAVKFYSISVTDLQWHYLNAFNSIARFSVPVFFMASGAFLLDPKRKLDIKTLFSKYVFKIVFIYIVWSLFYSIVSIVQEGYIVINMDLIKQLIYRTIEGPKHFWYLFTLGGIYLAVPILREVVKKRRLIEYFLLISFIFVILRSVREIVVIDTLELYIQYLDFNFTAGNILYFILGYYLVNFDFNKNTKTILYISTLVSVIFTILMTINHSYDGGIAYEGFYGYQRPAIILTSIGVFVAFKSIFENHVFSEKTKKFFLTTSSLSLGIYIIHLFFVNIVGSYGLLDMMPIYFTLPILSILIYFVSAVLVKLLMKIKILKFFI
jgi:surface polysaccharide O-acyltransferase-like enzyme